MDHLASKRVLTVDDHPVSTRMVRLTLERTAGVQVRELNSPARTLEVAREFRPHVILLDIDMPGVDGSTVWRMLRATAEHRHTPIIFLTSRVTSEEAALSSVRAPQCRTSVLAKPVSSARLTECILGALAEEQSTDIKPAPPPVRATQ